MPFKPPTYRLPGLSDAANAVLARILQELELRPRIFHNRFNDTQVVTATTNAGSHLILSRKIALTGNDKVIISGVFDADIQGDASNSFFLGMLALVKPDGTRIFFSDVDNTNVLLGNDDASSDIRASVGQNWLLDLLSSTKITPGEWTFELRAKKLGTATITVSEHTTMLIEVH